MRYFRLIALVFFLSAVFQPAFACGQNVNWSANSATDAFNRLVRAETVDDAQTRARRARNEVQTLEMVTMQCCFLASTEFSNTSLQLRRVSNEDDPNEISNYIRRAVRSFNSGINYLNSRIC